MCQIPPQLLRASLTGFGGAYAAVRSQLPHDDGKPHPDPKVECYATEILGPGIH